MKKVLKKIALASVALCMTAFVACSDDDEGISPATGNNNNNNSTETGAPVLLDESFDDSLSADWTLIDADGDGRNWSLSTKYFSSPQGVDRSNCMVSSSYFQSIPISADNYLISPTIHIPGAGGYNLTYAVANYQKGFLDSYSCILGTLTNGAFNSIDTLISETPDNAIITIVNGVAVNAEGYAIRSFNLDAYKGQDICVAFRHKDENHYFICIDNVKISNESTQDTSITPTDAKNVTPRMK